MKTAKLGYDGKYTTFSYNGRCVRFMAPYSLECYTSVKEWDNGYLVVMAKYMHNTEPEEEYIDLIPILENLYIDPEEYLSSVKEVIISD